MELEAPSIPSVSVCLSRSPPLPLEVPPTNKDGWMAGLAGLACHISPPFPSGRRARAPPPPRLQEPITGPQSKKREIFPETPHWLEGECVCVCRTVAGDAV